MTSIQILERRLKMTLNHERVRAIARQWKYMLASAGMIALVALLLVHVSATRSGQAQPNPDEGKTERQPTKSIGSGAAQTQLNELKRKQQLVKSLYDNKALNDLLEMALRNPDETLRNLARIRLMDSQGEGSVQAMLVFYKQSSDPQNQRRVIDTLGRNGEIAPLTKIALSDPSIKNRRQALIRIKWLKETSESPDIKALDVSALQSQLDETPLEGFPPPPPPPMIDMTVEADKELTPLRWHENGKSAFAFMRQAIHAYMRRDVSFFEEMLDENYVGTGLDGETRNKAQEIEEIKSHAHEIKKVEFESFRASGGAGGGFNTSLVTAHFRTNGQDSSAQYRCTVNSINRQGKRKIVSFHISRAQ
jgi:hypothetical protein